jgi:hypothetical protein
LNTPHLDPFYTHDITCLPNNVAGEPWIIIRADMGMRYART